MSTMLPRIGDDEVEALLEEVSGAYRGYGEVWKVSVAEALMSAGPIVPSVNPNGRAVTRASV